jgi:cytochrome c oxidase subunit 3
MRNYSTHPFHLVDVSPWPILKSFGLLSGALALVSWLTLGQNNVLVYVVIFNNLVFIIYQWLITEVLLFASFFWAFFHSSLNPSVELAMWPPKGINAIDCWSVPLLNSILLLSAGFIITWAHHAFLNGEKGTSLFGMFISILLIAIFLVIQYVEYSNTEFTISDSVFGSVFFALTGLHGLHVMAAILLLTVSMVRAYTDQFTSEHCLCLDISILYFHFTDIVWLGLYLIVYYWGG